MLDTAFFATDETQELPVTVNGKTAIFVMRTALSVKEQTQIASASIEVKVVNGKAQQTQSVDASRTALAALAAYTTGYIPVNADGTRGEFIPLNLEQVSRLKGVVADALSDYISQAANAGAGEDFLAP